MIFWNTCWYERIVSEFSISQFFVCFLCSLQVYFFTCSFGTKSLLETPSNRCFRKQKKYFDKDFKSDFETYTSVRNNRPPPSPPTIINFWKIFQPPLPPPPTILFQPPPLPLLLIPKILASHKIKSHRFFVRNSKKELTSYWVSILNYIHAETIAL